ncbi:MAG: hypothetical protein ACFCBW_19575 [Candidatus Competibacterales bacterium]
MASSSSLTRRDFVRLCGATALLQVDALNAAAPVGYRPFETVALVDDHGRPLGPADLDIEREYLFYYPYRSTPSFLLRLAGPTQTDIAMAPQEGEDYRWPGGVGAEGSVVAFCAICTHKLSYPSPQVSFIGYRSQPVGFYATGSKRTERRSGVIQCCSEHSIYDPAAGAKVLAGPAPHPLTAIALEERDGALFATGVYGPTVYDRFFDRFGFQLALQHGGDYAKPVVGHSRVAPGDQVVRQSMTCS